MPAPVHPAIETAIILAGGLGTRLRAAVPDLPKPMAPVAGRPFLSHLFDYWIGQGIGHFVLSVGYRHEAISQHFGAHYRGATLAYAIEDSPRGTGGGLLLALAQVPGVANVLVLNGDTFFAVPLSDFQAFHAARQALWSFALFRPQESGRYHGLHCDAQGRVLQLRAASPAGQDVWANGGVYLLQPDAVRAAWQKPPGVVSLEDGLLPHLQAQGARLYAVAYDGAFIDIGVPDDYARAATVLAQERMP